MFGPVHVNQRRIRQPQSAQRRDPFMPQRQRQSSFNQSAININRFLPSGSTKSITLGKGVGGLTKILDNTQQVLRMVETATPMIKEYGPMIKNLPAMYKMVKAFKDIDAFTDKAEGKSKTEEEITADVTAKEVNKDKKEQELKEKELLPTKKGTSIPKLYI